MKEMIKLEWESKFFNYKIGSISNPKNNNIEIQENYKLIVVNQYENNSIIIDGYKEKYNEYRILFSKKISKKNEIKNNPLDFDEFPKSSKFFKFLAYESGKHSRFLLDKNFGEDKFKELYDTWIQNSIDKSFADKIFYFEEKGIAIAFITIKINKDTAKIGLISTHPRFQGQGYGKQLLEFTENYCLETNVYLLNIPTQEVNKIACTFYKNLGYEIADKYYIKHYWKI